jgi:hypothetical protein
MKQKKSFFIKRTPKNYDGSETTSRQLKELLPSVLSRIGGVYEERGDLVLASWPEIIGPKLAVMTEAISFESGVLVIRVKNSTLYSLLSQHDKPRILKNLRDKFPTTFVKIIVFRLG